MKIDKFGTITEKDGDLIFDGFTFSGQGSYVEYLLSVKKYIADKVDESIKDYNGMKHLDGITPEDVRWEFK